MGRRHTGGRRSRLEAHHLSGDNVENACLSDVEEPDDGAGFHCFGRGRDRGSCLARTLAATEPLELVCSNRSGIRARLGTVRTERCHDDATGRSADSRVGSSYGSPKASQLVDARVDLAELRLRHAGL